MARSKYSKLPIAKLSEAEKYFIAEAKSLQAMKGTPWIFIGIATMIDYLARLEKGKAAKREDYISLIKNRFPDAYKQFKYKTAHRKAGTGQPIRDKETHRVTEHQRKITTKKDLPEQMYFIFRCGLVHAFSLVPSSTERANGGRRRSITLHSRADAKRDGKKHLDNYNKPDDIKDAAYFVDEDLLDDLISAIRKVFATKTKHDNIRKVLKKQPPIWPF